MHLAAYIVCVPLKKYREVVIYVTDLDLSLEVKDWIAEQPPGSVCGWTYDLPKSVSFYFSDPKVAMHFKLRWG